MNWDSHHSYHFDSKINSTAIVRGCCATLVFKYILIGNFSQVHNLAGFWATALHKGLKPFYSHFCSEEVDMRFGIKLI